MHRGLVVLAGVLGVIGLCLAPALRTGAAPRGSDAETRYNACMDEIGADANKALATAEDWAKKGGGDPARHCAAAARMALGRFAEAAQELEALARDESKKTAASPALAASLWGQAAHAWLSADEPARAEAAATGGLALLPRNPALLTLRARAKGGQQHFVDAIPDLDQAIAADAASPEAYVYRASALRQSGVLDRASADLDKALSIDPQQPEALLERGIVRLLQGDEAGARADWQTLTQSAPKTPAAEEARLNLERLDKTREKSRQDGG